MASAVESEILRDLWYMAVPGQRLKRGQILGKKLLGVSMLLGRDASGEVFSMAKKSNVAITAGDSIVRGLALTFHRCCRLKSLISTEYS